MINKNSSSMAIGAIIIGFSPIVAKAVSLSPTLIGFYRFLFGALGISLFLLITRKKFHIESLKKALPFMAASGLLFALDLWFWHRSIVYIGAGIATLLANTQVFYLVILGWYFNREKPRWFFYPGMILALTGLSLASLPFVDFSTFDYKSYGVIFGLLTGVSYSFVAFFMQKSTSTYKGEGPIPIYFITIFAALFSLIFALFEGPVQLIEQKDLGYMLLYGAGIHFLGWLCITYAITRIPLALASLLLLLQPIFATVFGHIIYDESLNNTQIIGLALSLIGIYLASTAKTVKEN